METNLKTESPKFCKSVRVLVNAVILDAVSDRVGASRTVLVSKVSLLA